MASSLIAQHVKMTARFYDVTKEVYTGLAQLHCEHEGFKASFEAHHPELAEFMAEALLVYVHHNLSRSSMGVTSAPLL